MALSYKARRRWSLIILLVGLPLYIVISVNVIDLFGIQNKLIQLIVYVVLGVLWAFPLKSVFKGIGQDDPDKQD
jgi:hypothetical protein